MQAEPDTAVLDAPAPVDLSTVSTEDLMVALAGRFRHVAMIGATLSDEGEYAVYNWRWSGNRHFVKGLCVDLAERVQTSAQQPTA